MVTAWVAVSERFPASPAGGGVGLETVAVLVIGPAGTDGSSATTRTMVGAPAPAGSGADSVQVTTWVGLALQLHVGEPAGSAETNVSPAGNWSETVTGDWASDGPSLVTSRS